MGPRRLRVFQTFGMFALSVAVRRGHMGFGRVLMVFRSLLVGIYWHDGSFPVAAHQFWEGGG